MSYKYLDERGEHLHTLGEKPLMGTTTIINEIFPPPLVWYGSKKALEPFGYITPTEKNEKGKYKKNDDNKRIALIMAKWEEIKEMSPDALLDFLDSCYKNHDTYKKSKGKEGTNIHSMIEEYIKDRIVHHKGQAPKDGELLKIPIEIKSFVEWSMHDVKEFLWSEAHCYSKELWVGGITDFGFIHKEGKIIIGDAKPSIYPKNFIQTSAYDLQITENGLMDTMGKSILSPIQIEGYFIWDYNKGIGRYRTDTQRLKDIFKLVVDLYKNKDVIGSNIL